MSNRAGNKAFVAEVIDMDGTDSYSSRPSDRFTKRVNLESGIPLDDPASRFLFDDSLIAQNRRKRKRHLRKIRDFGFAFVMGMAGAWIVWVTPGLGPMEQQSELQKFLLQNQTEILGLQKQLVQSQVKAVELVRTTEVQRTLLEQGEAARRAMMGELQRTESKLEQALTSLTQSQQRIDELATVQMNNAAFSRKQADALDDLKDDFVRIDEDLKMAKVESQIEVANLKSDQLQRQKEELQRFSHLLDSELASLKQGDLNDMRSRMERLAEHVWQEVGRLDGRIVRASATTEEKTSK